MKAIDKQLINQVCKEASQSERLRKNYNFHEDLNDPINRLLNAMQPGTYVRPHRHLATGKQEIFVVLQGKIAFFIFNDEGDIVSKRLIGPNENTLGMDLEANWWHSLVVLEPNTVIYEIKTGPFIPLAPEDLAPWSPDASDKDACKKYIQKLKDSIL